MNQKIIYKNKVKNNLDYYKSFAKKLVIMVKADAYGHCVKTIAKVLKNEDVCLGVATVEEGVRLREFWKKDILVVEPVSHFEGVKKHKLLFAVDNLSSLYRAIIEKLNENCYIKINTGMNRFGVKYSDKVLGKMAGLAKKHKIRGLMTHFSCLDDEKFTLLQMERFEKVKKKFPANVSVSFGGSQVVTDGRLSYDELRVGIGFYGYGEENLMPIMSLKSQVLKVLELKAGESLGYDNAFVAEKKTRIAVVGVGYGDGIDRRLSGFHVYINGTPCEIVGKICMDCLFVRVDGRCREKDEVVFENASVTAKHLGTISYEVLTRYSAFRGEVVVY